MNVLLAVDQSKNSSGATAFVEALRLPASSKLYVLYVVEPQELRPEPDESSPMFAKLREELSNIRQKTIEKARELVHRLSVPFSQQNIEIHPMVAEGTPGGEILTALDKYQIDLLALGTKGLTGMKRFLLGSVSEWMLYDAPCSVLVVRSQAQQPTASNARGLHVLLAMNGSSDSWKAVTLLKTLKLPETSRLTILHVVEKPAGLKTLEWVSGQADATMFSEDCRRTGRQAGTQLLEEIERDLKGEAFEVDTKLTEGHAADEILKAAQDIRTDLIVVGSKGVTGFRRMMMLGGVSNKVVRHAPCSVLVARNVNPSQTAKPLN